MKWNGMRVGEEEGVEDEEGSLKALDSRCGRLTEGQKIEGWI